MGKSQRVKGAVGERELAGRWQVALPHVNVRRTGQDQAHQAKQKPGDIDVGGLPYCVEAKRRKRLSWTVIREGLEQAALASSETQMPVLCAREDRGKWVAVVDLEDFLALVSDRERLLNRLTASVRPEVRPPAPGGAHAEKIAHGGCQHVWGPFVCDPVCSSNDGRTCTRCGAFQGE